MRPWVSDWMLLGLILGISLLGLLAVYSSSGIYASEKFGDPYFYIRRQAIYWCVGWGLLFLFAKIPIKALYRATPLLVIGAILLMGLVLLLGDRISGSTRWISISGFRFQPVELMKLALCLFLATRFPKFQAEFMHDRVPWRELVPVALTFLLILGLTLAQPDFGNTIVMTLMATTALFCVSFPLVYFVGALLLLAPFSLVLILISPYRVDRLMGFLEPWNDPRGAGFQLIQSLIGFSKGELLGTGLGSGQQKLFYLPEAHNDFIVSVIGEESGWLGITFLLALFGALFFRMIQKIRTMVRVEHQLLGTMILAMIAIPVWINIFVALGLFPTKGLPLPLVSSGGSSLLVTMASLGLFFNLASDSKSIPAA